VDRLDGDRDSRQSRGQGCEKARLGRARVDHVRPEPAEEGHQAAEGAEVPRGRELADQAHLGVMRHPAGGDLRMVVALGPGLPAEDEMVVDGGRAPVIAGRQERDLLRAADDHAGDDVDDAHSHPRPTRNHSPPAPSSPGAGD